MKKIGKIKILAVIAALLALMAMVCGCVRADVRIKKDGSGTATVTISQSEGGIDEARRKIDEIFAGVEAVTGEKERLSLVSLRQISGGYEAVINFKRIQNTKGLGNFDYMKASDFLLELNKTSAISGKWALGRYGTVQMYNQSIYEFNERDDSLAIIPIDVESKEEIEPANFVAKDGVLSRSENGMMFTYFIAGFNGLESITFKFNGTIKYYGGKNIEIIAGDTIKITPVKVRAKILKSDAQYITEDTDCFVGYVYFEENTSFLLAGILIGAGLAAIALVIVGIRNKFFSRVIKSNRFKLVIKNYDLYLMLLPAMVIIIIFAYVPMTGIVLAFKNFSIDEGIWGSEWAPAFGFQNFIDIFTKPGASFWMLAKNTLILSGLKFIFGFLCSITLSVLFNYLREGVFKKTVQTISYFPYFISWIVIAGIAYLFLSADGGILNKIVTFFGGDPVKWYSEPRYWPTILTFTSIWKTLGYSTIVYIAAMTAIDSSLYEAAIIDGGSRFQQLIYITLPGMSPIIGIQLIFSLGNLVRDDFDQIYSMTGGSNPYLRDTTEVISTVVYKAIGGGFSAYGSATAMSLFQSVVALILVLCANKIVKKYGMEGAF